MATGTTANSAYRRDEIIGEALAKVHAQTNDGSYSLSEIDRAVKALNKIIRKEDLRGVDKNTHLWALSEAGLFMAANVHIYSSSNGLKSDILDIKSLVFRGVDGTDTQVETITAAQWGTLVDKSNVGDVKRVYFKRDRLLASQQFYVNPAPLSITTSSEVVGTDALNYKCLLKHEAAAINRPITGAAYKLYWQQEGSSGSAWASGTDYVNGELLYYVYKRPLFDFDLPTDNPDMPLGWEDYLIYQLAFDLSPNYSLPLQERNWLRARAKDARDELFPSSRSGATDIYNKGSFF